MLKRTLTHTHAYSQTHKHARASHTHTMNPNLLTYTQIHVCKHATHIVNRHTNLHAPSHTHTHTNIHKKVFQKHTHIDYKQRRLKNQLGRTNIILKVTRKKGKKEKIFLCMIKLWFSYDEASRWPLPSIHRSSLPRSLGPSHLRPGVRIWLDLSTVTLMQMKYKVRFRW